MNAAITELKSVRASLSNLLTSAKSTSSEHPYTKGYVQGLEHAMSNIEVRISILEQNQRINEMQNGTATI